MIPIGHVIVHPFHVERKSNAAGLLYTPHTWRITPAASGILDTPVQGTGSVRSTQHSI
jgi:hypothetical protein